jgi:hypothetical protein
VGEAIETEITMIFSACVLLYRFREMIPWVHGAHGKRNNAQRARVLSKMSRSVHVAHVLFLLKKTVL